MTNLEKTADLVGRVLIAVIFVKSGFDKIGGYAGTQAYMDAAGVPGALRVAGPRIAERGHLVTGCAERTPGSPGRCAAECLTKATRARTGNGE